MIKKSVTLLSFVILLISCEKSDLPTFNPVITEPVPVAFPCSGGMAGIYPCNGYDLVSHISLDSLNGLGISGNDCWGWVDPNTQKEYALICTSVGTSFIDITDGINPIVLGHLPTNTVNSIWRDVKTYGTFAFIVSEASNHGMQVFDLTKLRDIDITNAPVTFSADAVYNGFGRAHNIVINEDNAYAYAVGTTTFSGGPHFVDISDPLNPTAAGGYANDAYSHDAQVITYNGPDTDYTGQEILIGSNENEVVIVDITDKTNPARISTIDYANIGYTHQGWFTEDFRYFILGDELDERNFGINTRNIIFDFSDLDNPIFHMDYYGPTAAIDHNGYVKEELLYLSNYTAGVRMIDLANIASGSISEMGFFDTYPENNATSFNGVWNVYPFFPSGNIIVSDIDNGFFVIRKSQQ